MADSRVDPVAKYKFMVEVKDVVTAWFTECSGLSVERETIPQKEGGVNDYVHQLPGRISYSRITLKWGLADNKLWDWFQKGLYDGKVERHNISIILYNSDVSKAKRWNLADAYPVKWTGPDFQGDSNQVAVETLEIVHHGMTMVDWTKA